MIGVFDPATEFALAIGLLGGLSLLLVTFAFAGGNSRRFTRRLQEVTTRKGGRGVDVPRGTSGALGAAAGPWGVLATGAPGWAGAWAGDDGFCSVAVRFPIAFGKKTYSPAMQASQMATATSRFWFWFFMRFSFACAAARGLALPRPTGGSGAGV